MQTKNIESLAAFDNAKVVSNHFAVVKKDNKYNVFFMRDTNSQNGELVFDDNETSDEEIQFVYNSGEEAIINRELDGLYGYTCKSTTTYGNKKSFGDLDIVVAYTGNDKLLPLITEEFKPTELFDDPNQNIISFNYHDLSVDLIFVSDQDFDFAHNYLSYNDLGNLIGKTCCELCRRSVFQRRT
jgi:hypothetical protein